MSKKKQGKSQGHKQGHQKQHGKSHSSKKKKGVHQDWRTWVVVLMLVGMVIYVLSDDESITPEGEGQGMPAAEAPAE